MHDASSLYKEVRRVTEVCRLRKWDGPTVTQRVNLCAVRRGISKIRCFSVGSGGGTTTVPLTLIYRVAICYVMLAVVTVYLVSTWQVL